MRVSRRRFVTGTATAAAALATRRPGPAPARLTLAAAGDCIITRHVRHIDDPDFLPLALQPFPETIALLEKLGAKNNHKCISC